MSTVMENTHNEKLSEAIRKVLKDMENLSQTELLGEILKNMQKDIEADMQTPLYHKGQEVKVDFALGSAAVIIKDFLRIFDGSIVYHVEDKNTGHQDFVGQENIRPL